MIKERKKKKEVFELTLYPTQTWIILRRKITEIILMLEVTKKFVRKLIRLKFKTKTKLKINSKK